MDLVIIILVWELVPLQCTVPAQQEDPEDGEGDGERDQEDGGHQGRHQVLGVARVDLVGGGMVASHVHLGPATHKILLLCSHNCSW